MFYLKIIYTISVSLSFVHCQIDLPTQPTWLLDHHAAKDFSSKVEVNLKNLLETASIRSEIESAVHLHKYAVGGKNEDKIVHQADKELGQEYRHSENILGMAEDPLAELDLGRDEKYADPEQKNAGAFEIVPNKIASSLFDDNQSDGVFIPEYNADKYRADTDSREMLQLNLIEEDLNFSIGIGVSMWKSLGRDLLLGLAGSKVIFVGKVNGSYEIINELSFEESVTTVDTVTQWNATSKSMSTMAIISQANSIHWIDTEWVVEIWKWRIGDKVLCMQPFKFGRLRYLAILIDGRIIIYHYNIRKFDYLAIQSIRMDDAAQQMVYFDVGYHMVLAIPQNNSILILQSDSSTKGALALKKMPTLSADNMTTIEGFQMGGYSYLAVGGKQPKIYRYHYGTFRAQTILQQNFGLVDRFLAIPIRTYRDDMILLVQHTITFESHHLTVVEPLIWNGEAFETTKSVPCKIGATVDLFGASCVLDMERETGIAGSAASISSQGEVFIVVPRLDAPSGRFRIDTQLVSRRSDIDDLEIILKNMQAMIADQEKALDLLSDTKWYIEELQVNEMAFDDESELGSIWLNDQEWSDTEQSIDLDSLLEILENSDQELDGRERLLSVERAFIEELHVENVTGETSTILEGFKHDGTVIFEGNLVAEDLILEQSLMQVRDAGQEHELDLLEIEGDLEFESVNGLVWTDFMNQVVYKDTPSILDDVEVTKVVIDGDLLTESMNRFKFPNDFLLSSGPQYSEIFARKNFTNMLNTNAMDCNATINNVEPVNYITLEHRQEISGRMTISELEVTDSFEINGTIAGKNIENFITNPTLRDANHIKSECQFKNIEVHGPIAITGSFNRKKFDDILNDVVYISDKDIIMLAKKTFNNVQFDHPIKLESTRISDIPLDEFLTKSSEQQLTVDEIEGSLNIENLQLDGLYNFINVTELELNSIKLNEDANVDVDLVFNDPALLEVETVEVLHSLDNIPLDDFLKIHEHLRFKRVIVEEFIVDELNSICSVEGSGKLNGVDLAQFTKERLSISEDQVIESDLFINRIEIDSDLITKFINGNPTDQLFNLAKKSLNILESLRSTSHLKVTGKIEINTLNGVDMRQLWSKVIWLDRQNTITGQIEFLDSIHLQCDLYIKSDIINGRSIGNFVDDLVLKHDSDTTPLTITGSKRFTSSIRVINDAQVEVFNDIPSNLLATKIKPIKIEGNLHVDGNLVIHSLDMEGEKFAELRIQKIFETYQYDPILDMHYINAEVEFKGRTVVEQLNVDGRINGLEGPRDVFPKLVYKNATITVTGKKIFQSRIDFEQGVEIEQLNRLDLYDFFKRVVYVNENQPVELWKPVVFRSSITADQVHVEGDIVASIILGCKLDDWIINSLRVDQSVEIEGPMYFPEGVLDGSNLLAAYVNDKPMAELITLHTPQELKGNLTLPFALLDGTVIVSNGVNGRDVVRERQNTLMIYGDQHITAPIVTQSLCILRSLETLKPINGRNLRQVATLHDDLHLRSSFSFKRVKVKKLYTSDLISGLNFTEWYTSSLKTGTLSDQSITGIWSIDEMTIQSPTIDIEPPLILQNYTDFLPAIKSFQHTFKDSCERVRKLKDQADLRVTYLKYLKKRFEIVLKRKVDSVHPIGYGKTFLILLNTECVSKVYHWKVVKGNFERVGKIETGIVERVEVLPDHSFTTVSVWKPEHCTFYDTARWKFDGGQVVPIESSVKPVNHHTTYYRQSSEENVPLPNFNATIDSIAKKLISDLRSIQRDDFNKSVSPIVSSPAEHHSIGHTITNVAKRLWSGFQHLDDVQTIMHSARNIYHTLVSPDHKHESYHSAAHDNHDTYTEDNGVEVLHDGKDHDGFQDDNHPGDEHDEPHDHDIGDLEQHQYHNHNHQDPEHDSIVGAGFPFLLGFPVINSATHTVQHITGYRTHSLLNAIPLGFEQLVESSTGRANNEENEQHGIQAQVQHLIGTIVTTINSMPTVNYTFSKTGKRFEADKLATLQRYAQATTTEGQSSNVVPQEGHREVIRLTVGGKKNRLKLIAVISPSNTTVIRIYHLNVTSVFQIIQTSRPHSLTSLEIKYETILAFVESVNVIRVMRYRGVQGFVEWSSFRQDANIPVTQLTSMTLPGKLAFCRKFYLISVHWEHVEFYEVVIGGVCPLNLSIGTCNGWW